MTNDLVKRLENVRCDGVEELCWEAADCIKALQAERCVDVSFSHLKWEYWVDSSPASADTPIGKYRVTKVRGQYRAYFKNFYLGAFDTRAEAQRCAQKEHYELELLTRMGVTVTTRPASEVQAEAHAAAIEAAAKVAWDKHSAAMEWASAYLNTFDGETDSKRIAEEIRALHTDASLAAIEWIKREAREEALRDMLGLTINHAPERDDIHAAITALIEKEGV